MAAKKYTRLLRSIWRDKDFTGLPASAQRTYLMLISQPDISPCGVLPLLVARWATLAPDTDADSVRADLEVLAEAAFVVFDDDTLELWVRGYMKVDELFVSPNGRKALDAAREAVTSDLLRARIEATYLTLVGGGPQGAGEGAGEGPRSPQQPAALALSSSESSSRDRAGDPPDGFDDVIDCMVSIRLRSETGIKHPARYAKALKRDLPSEHGGRIRLLMKRFPGAPCSSIAAAALSGDLRPLAAYATPTDPTKELTP